MSQVSLNLNDETARARLQSQKERLRALRDSARERYASGLPALQTASLICQSLDRLVIDLLEDCFSRLDACGLDEVKAQGAVLAVGGTGRGELAPYSDVDLLFLQESSNCQAYSGCVEQVVRDCWDAGIQLGHRVATPADALTSALADPIFATALVEMRLLWGSPRIFESFRGKFDRVVLRRRYTAFYRKCLAARAEERQQNGDTDRQLEPDVKRSPGGLRDIQLVRWIGYAHCGTTDIDLMRRGGFLSRRDADRLIEAQDFLMRVRTELHFAAGKPQEILTRDEQLRIAEILGFEGSAAQRPVEQFMQKYLQNVTDVADIASRFVHRQRPQQWRELIRRYLFARRDNQHFLANTHEIFPAPRQSATVLGRAELLFQLYELAAQYGARVPPEFSEQIREAVPLLPPQPSAEVNLRFLSILKTEKGLGKILRDMYANGLLGYVLPEFTGIRCLLQFNQYHAYTVDEHTLRAIEAVEELRGQGTPLRESASAVSQKEMLHLALLLHDAGKGHTEDHCLLGERLARTAAERLGLDPARAQLLAFLVRQHLLMTTTAFRRDLNDPATLIEFSREVGSAAALRLLFVHSAADMRAVGPTTFTGWKEELLTLLYLRALEYLSGTLHDVPLAEQRETLWQHLAPLLPEWPDAASASETANGTEAAPLLSEKARWLRLIEGLPAHYIFATPPEQIARDMVQVANLEQSPVTVTGTIIPESRTVEYRVITRDRPGSGLFSRITGTLTAKGMSILSAGICTTSDQVAIDSFRVEDDDYSGVVPEFRLREVERTLVEVVSGKLTVEELFRRHQRRPRPASTSDSLCLPPRVAIDNRASATATVIDVFANDRRGLLYTIARTLFELNLSVNLAKITTHVDQVLDVFYVTDMRGEKIPDPALPRMEQALLASVIEFESKHHTGAAAPAV